MTASYTLLMAVNIIILTREIKIKFCAFFTNLMISIQPDEMPIFAQNFNNEYPKKPNSLFRTPTLNLVRTRQKEFAFIGRSNVGKSSLINMLMDEKKLAKTSGRPGKTQLINHFEINKAWYVVDLPGYGYAKVSKRDRNQWQKFIVEYLTQSEQLLNVFVLLE